MEHVKYRDFIGELIAKGKVVPGSDFFDFFGADFHSLSASESDVKAVRSLLSDGEGDVIVLNGVNYSVTHNLISDQPFSVTGYTGDSAYGEHLKSAVMRDISLLQSSVDSFLDMSVNVSGSFNHQFPVEPYQAARRIYESWYKQSIRYIKEHLAYNLLDDEHELFDSSGADLFWSDTLKNGGFFEGFKSFDELSQLPVMLDFKRLLAHIVSEFNEDYFNRATLVESAKELASSYVSKKTHNAFDKFKLVYSTWDNERFNAVKYKTWTDALGVCCADQGKAVFYSSFINSFANHAVPCSGDGVTCGDVVVRKYKEHITLAIPKDISISIGVFINKYAPDYLQELTE